MRHKSEYVRKREESSERKKHIKKSMQILKHALGKTEREIIHEERKPRGCDAIFEEEC
jgi:hypothetical protein